jgi:hypothetical protein
VTTAFNLLLFADSCSGIPGAPSEASLRALADSILAHAGPADAICYLGDHVSGYTESEAELRNQWRHFLETEFRPLAVRHPNIRHIPSNHTAYSAMAARVYGEVLPVAGSRDLVARKGLNYALRDQRALLVFLNTADAGNNGDATLDLDWLGATLAENAAVPLKLVFGHHPIHSVNGYCLHPLWRVAPELGARAWGVLRASGVSAYICSHILAFDFQVHDGVIQLCTAGGGASYGPGGLMPASVEYHHFVECSFRKTESGHAFRCAVTDVHGVCRERISWPPEPVTRAAPFQPTTQPVPLAAPRGWDVVDAAKAKLLFSLSGIVPELGAASTVLCGWSPTEAPPILWIGFEGAPPRLVVKAVPVPGCGQQVWNGPALAPGADFTLCLLLDPAAGPGGVLLESTEGLWTSLETSCAQGLARTAWPEFWALGRGPVDAEDAPFRGPLPIVTLAALDPPQ